jgi:hypothetical protein
MRDVRAHKTGGVAVFDENHDFGDEPATLAATRTSIALVGLELHFEIF